MRELTSWEIYQIERWGNILEVPDMEIEEPGEDQARRFQEWDQLQHERLMHEYDDQYTNNRL